MASSMSVSILLQLRDQLTAPARQAGRSFGQMGNQMKTASAQITAGANQSAAAVNRLGSSANATSAAIGRLATNMRNARTMAAGFTGLGLGGGTGLIAAFPLVHMLKNAADYESKLIDIRKIWLGSESDYKRLVGGLKELNSQLPLSRIEIGKVLEEGIRSGVSQDVDELKQFTRASAAFSVAFQVPVNEAAVKLAKIKGSLGMTMDEFVALADTMNTVTAKIATSEAEMLEHLRRVGGLAKSIGGTQGLQDVIAIGAAQMAAGTPKEVAATGLRTLLARLSTQPKPTRNALATLGFDAEQIKRELPQDIFGTVYKLIDAIAKAPKHKQAGLLADLAGMKSFDAFARLLSNMTLMEGALETVRGKFRLTIESELLRRVNSLNSLFQITSNMLGDLSDSIVMAWRPQIVWLLGKIRELSLSMESSPILQWTAALFAGLAALSLIALPFGILGASLFSALLGIRVLGLALRGIAAWTRPLATLAKAIAVGLLGGGVAIARQAALMLRYAGAIGLASFAMRRLLRFAGWGLLIEGAIQVVQNWDAVKAVFADPVQAKIEWPEMPAWLATLADTWEGLRGRLKGSSEEVDQVRDWLTSRWRNNLPAWLGGEGLNAGVAAAAEEARAQIGEPAMQAQKSLPPAPAANAGVAAAAEALNRRLRPPPASEGIAAAAEAMNKRLNPPPAEAGVAAAAEALNRRLRPPAPVVPPQLRAPALDPGVSGVVAGAGRFATLPEGIKMPLSIQAGPVTNNSTKNTTIHVGGVTVNVSQTNASPEAIGAAAASAVGSKLRGALSDAPANQ